MLLKRNRPPATSVGTNRSVVVPSPSCPDSFGPQQYPCPVSASTPHACPPTLMLVKRRLAPPLPTSSGTDRRSNVPSPIRPSLPQQYPSPVSAATPQLSSPLVLMLLNRRPPLWTSVGTHRVVEVPSPRFPNPFHPQQ